jgi:hypothetical protein
MKTSVFTFPISYVSIRGPVTYKKYFINARHRRGIKMNENFTYEDLEEYVKTLSKESLSHKTYK